MANDLYPTGRSGFLDGSIDWDDDTFRVYLLSSTYVYSDADEFVSSLTGILGTPQTLTGTTVILDGIADADDLVYPDVTIGQTVTAVVIAKWTGSSATSPLVYFADTNNDTTPISRAGSGAGIPLVWSASDTRIFKL